MNSLSKRPGWSSSPIKLEKEANVLRGTGWMTHVFGTVEGSTKARTFETANINRIRVIIFWNVKQKENFALW